MKTIALILASIVITGCAHKVPVCETGHTLVTHNVTLDSPPGTTRTREIVKETVTMECVND